MPITYDEAYAQTDPNADPDKRELAATNIMQGVAANDIYLAHQGRLAELEARSQGHGIVTRGADEVDPTGVGTATDADVIEGTAVDDTSAALGTGAGQGAGSPVAGSSATTSAAPAASPSNPMESVAALRKQLQDAGMEPAA